MENRNYWVVSPNVKNNDEENNWKDFLSIEPFSFMGWNKENKFGNTFINTIKKGDVIINAQRKNWEPYVYGIGIVLNDKCDWQEIDKAPSGAYCRQLNPYLTKERVSKLQLDFNGTAYYGKNKQIPALYQLHPYSNENDKRLVEIIEKELEMVEKEQYTQKFIDILLANKNIILTGAPGTGKTYLAKQIAKQIIGIDSDDELANSGQFGFVQFHPSYDYTDFVEGLRPTKPDSNGNIGFELKNGVFKEFCNNAKQDKSSEDSKKYVFIIDEINRGEISKIFGELFFSIDPSYRGIKGAVKTQYANMYDDTTETFYIPENVYIIGSMNDIDRSVESFDFAMRRRFTWIEITAEESATNMNLLADIVSKMNNLNKEISNIEGLDSSFHIGGAYFLDSDGKPRTDLEDVYKFRIESLLKEYLRGLPDVEEKLKKLKSSYFSDENNGQ